MRGSAAARQNRAHPPAHTAPLAGPAGHWPQAAAAWQQQVLGFATTPDSGSETHDDFKPKYKAEPVADVNDTIKKDIDGNKVFIYMKVWGRRGQQQRRSQESSNA
jgi:hypothetical protein